MHKTDWGQSKPQTSQEQLWFRCRRLAAKLDCLGISLKQVPTSIAHPHLTSWPQSAELSWLLLCCLIFFGPNLWKNTTQEQYPHFLFLPFPLQSWLLNFPHLGGPPAQGPCPLSAEAPIPGPLLRAPVSCMERACCLWSQLFVIWGGV